MMPDPEISVVTAAYNPGPEIRTPAAALGHQSLRGFEWIIVDDASSPEHEAHIAEAADRAGVPVRVLRQPSNGGQAAARNRGIAAARAPWVKFLDADDAIDPQHLRNLLQAARASPAGALPFAPTRHVYPVSGREWVNTAYERAGPEPLGQLAVLLDTPFLSHCGVLFPRALLTGLGGYDETLRSDEDGDLLIRVLLAGHRFFPVPASNYVYRHDAGRSRVSRDDTAEKLAARLRVCEKVAEHFGAAGAEMPRAIRHSVARRMDAVALRAWRSEPALARNALRRAAELEPRDVPLGGTLVRLMRRAIGIGPTLRLLDLARQLRAETV